MTLPIGDRFHSIPICVAVYAHTATQKVAPLANTAFHICHGNQVPTSGGSALPLFAECFELQDDLVHFWLRETL